MSLSELGQLNRVAARPEDEQPVPRPIMDRILRMITAMDDRLTTRQVHRGRLLMWDRLPRETVV